MNSCCVNFHALIVNLAAVALLLLVGCSSANNSSAAKKAAAVVPQPLVLLVVDDPQLGQAVSREWRGRTEEELTIRDVTNDEVAKASRLPGDAVIFPSGLIGQLAERGLISPLEPSVLEDADFNYRDIFDQIRMGDMRWGNRTIAAPLGSPQFLLAYRTDIFEKLGLKPPEDWTEYQQAVVRLTDRAALGDLAPPADQPWRATIEPLAPGWSGQLLLARAAAYAMHRDQISPLFRFDTMTPLIDQPPYVRALEELVTTAKAGGSVEMRSTPPDVFAEIRSGRCAMAVAWPISDAGEAPATDFGNKLRFALLPGSGQAYRFGTKAWENRGPDESWHVPLRSISGRLAALTASSADPRRAQGFVVWLAGRDVSQQIGPRSSATMLFRNSQVTTSGRWTGSLSPDASRQYAEVLAQSFSLPRSSPGITLPGRADYLAALEAAVEQAMGGKPAAEALAEAAKQWTAITEKLGVDAQRRANSRSLGKGDL